jgi:hypothetical protein
VEEREGCYSFILSRTPYETKWIKMNIKQATQEVEWSVWQRDSNENRKLRRNINQNTIRRLTPLKVSAIKTKAYSMGILLTHVTFATSNRLLLSVILLIFHKSWRLFNFFSHLGIFGTSILLRVRVYGQQHLMLNTCSLILAIMPLQQERYKIQSVKSDVLLTVPTLY